MVSVEQHMRRLFADQGKNDMVLPICNKSMRKKLQALGALFGLNCTNKCSKLERYTTLTKVKKHSGKVIDEQQVARMMEKFKRCDDDGGGKGKGKGKSKGKSKEKGQSGHLKTKEGDVVGRVRARWFTESNSPGFRLTNGSFLHRLPRRSARRTSGSCCWRQWAGQMVRPLDVLGVWRLRLQWSSRRPGLGWVPRKHGDLIGGMPASCVCYVP
jgi:hypothetical protein